MRTLLRSYVVRLLGSSGRLMQEGNAMKVLFISFVVGFGCRAFCTADPSEESGTPIVALRGLLGNGALGTKFGMCSAEQARRFPRRTFALSVERTTVRILRAIEPQAATANCFLGFADSKLGENTCA